MVELDCAVHDGFAAASQFVTHLTGRVLQRLDLKKSPVDTRGFESLLHLVDNTAQDSWDLFFGLYKFNASSDALLQQFESAFNSVKRQLHRSNAPQHQTDIARIPHTKSIEERLSRFATTLTPSPTVRLMTRVAELRAAGNKVVRLSVGEPDFAPPPAVLEATRNAASSGHVKYTPVKGTAGLRAAICQHLLSECGLNYDPEQVVVSCGAKQLVYQAARCLLDPGDEVVIPAPAWVSYEAIARMAGAVTVMVPIWDSVQGQAANAADLIARKVTDRTKLVILCNPCNPTGALVHAASLAVLAKALEAFPKVVVLADEIYRDLLFSGATHAAFASITGMFERTVTIGGFSKSFAMTGFRVGYLACPDAELIRAISILQGQINSCAPSVSQFAAECGLADPSTREWLADRVCELERKRDAAVARLRGVQRFSVPFVPEGGLYIMVGVTACM
eukprot:Polyplicarium_translucidae@DN273_c0_g1_i1.p1